MFFINGGTVPLLINQGTSRLHRAIRVIKNSQLSLVQIMSGSRGSYSDHPYDLLTRITRRRDFGSERQLSHLKPIELRKFNPITVNPLTVRGSQKHPSTLTNCLP